MLGVWANAGQHVFHRHGKKGAYSRPLWGNKTLSGSLQGSLGLGSSCCLVKMEMHDAAANCRGWGAAWQAKGDVGD